MTRSRRLTAAAAISVALCAIGGPASAQTTPAPTGPAITTAPPIDEASDEVIHSWALAPAASPDGTVGGNRSVLSYVGDPGSVIRDQVTLYNFSNVPLTFRVYGTDAFNNDEGQFDLLPAGEPPTAVGAWISVTGDAIPVPPGAQVTLPITLRIPAGASPGDHAGAVVASSEALSTGPGGEAVRVDRRVGTRLYLRVNGPLNPELAVAALATSYRPAANPLAGKATVTYTIENRGNVRMGGTALARLAGPFGIAATDLPPQEVPELLPGEAVTLTAEADDVAATGALFTTLSIEPLEDAVAVGASTWTRRTVSVAFPVVGLLLLVLLLLALLLRRSIRRHRRDQVATSTAAMTRA